MKIMNKIFFTIVVLLLVSCSTIKNEHHIIYVIDRKLEKCIYNELNKSEFKVAFYIQNIDNSLYKIHLTEINDSNLLHSNRRLFINDKSYPIIFETDYIFYSKTKNNIPIVSFEKEKNVYIDIPMPSIEKRNVNPNSYGYPSRFLIMDSSIYWVIDKQQNLIETNSECK